MNNLVKTNTELSIVKSDLTNARIDSTNKLEGISNYFKLFKKTEFFLML